MQRGGCIAASAGTGGEQGKGKVAGGCGAQAHTHLLARMLSAWVHSSCATVSATLSTHANPPNKPPHTPSPTLPNTRPCQPQPRALLNCSTPTSWPGGCRRWSPAPSPQPLPPSTPIHASPLAPPCTPSPSQSPAVLPKHTHAPPPAGQEAAGIGGQLLRRHICHSALSTHNPCKPNKPTTTHPEPHPPNPKTCQTPSTEQSHATAESQRTHLLARRL